MLRLNYFMSSYVSWLTDLCYRLLPDCISAQTQISHYVNVMGIIQLCEGFRVPSLSDKHNLDLLISN